jgi:hypothetical protein
MRTFNIPRLFQYQRIAPFLLMFVSIFQNLMGVELIDI